MFSVKTQITSEAFEYEQWFGKNGGDIHHCSIYMLNLDFFGCNTHGDGGDDISQGWETDENAVDRDGMQSSDRLLFLDIFTPFIPSPLIMKSVTRFTSDNLTGFNRNSSAPSSKQLPISKNKQWIIGSTSQNNYQIWEVKIKNTV